MDGTSVGEVQAGAPVVDRRSRRWAAFFLSWLAPGLGHLAIGYPRRMVAWFSSVVVITACMIAFARSGITIFVPIALVLAGLVRLAAGIDTLRQPRPAELPRPRNVLLMAVGLFAFWEIISYQVRNNVVEAFQIPAASMYPTLEVGDHIFASKAGQKYGAGDVIVFKFPRDPSTTYVKRIAAVGGDTIEIRDDVLMVNGAQVPRVETSLPCQGVEKWDHTCKLWEEQVGSRRYLVAHDAVGSGRSMERVIVPDGHVFVLGDNRDNSSDSRVWGTVAPELVVGKVVGIWWSRGPEGIRWDRINQPVR